ncbi:hypothetical protein QYE76_060743 [Lolium multiflorum]|uniref:Uncharacterized protein n=1 Tax=Lolium multiflorum TaxID=4521 RepID=A0AAD8S101_LOLMU|nr:hypothetical protein QYE76_060743 [Lolium multiflorum]
MPSVILNGSLLWLRRSLRLSALALGILFLPLLVFILSREKYFQDLLARAALGDERTVDTPMEINVKLRPTDVIEFSERLSYFGIAMSLMIYLTKVLHQDMKVATNNVQYWMGVTTLMPLLGGFLADAYPSACRSTEWQRARRTPS